MEAALPDFQRDQELRYVTGHFADLQGLRMAPFWAAILALDMAGPTWASSRSLTMWTASGTLLLTVAWVIYGGRWYRRRYGVITPRPDRIQSPVLSIRAADQPISAKVPRGTKFLFFVALTTLGPALFLPIFKHGTHHAGPSALLVFGVYMLQKAILGLPPGPEPISPWILARLCLAVAVSATMCVAYVGSFFGYLKSPLFVGAAAGGALLAGLYDHWLLNRLLTGSSRDVRHA